MAGNGQGKIDLERLVETVMNQRENRDEVAHHDDDGLFQAYIGAKYAAEALATIKAEKANLRQ